jgi:transcription initiation factor IIE alpha subunit
MGLGGMHLQLVKTVVYTLGVEDLSWSYNFEEITVKLRAFSFEEEPNSYYCCSCCKPPFYFPIFISDSRT